MNHRVAESEIELSVVTPVYKAAECVDELYRRLVGVLEQIGKPFEIVMVNDGSPDESWRLIQGIARRDPRVRGINLSRNFGQHRAITAGLDHCRGRWAVVMDCDLQHVPEDISRLYAKALDGHDIVLVRRLMRRDPFWKKLASRAFVSVYNYLSDVKVDPSISSYSIISRRVVGALGSLREGNRTYTLLLHWVGFDVAYIDGEHAERFAGTSAYSLAKSINLAIESISSQSNRPLRLSINFGFLLSLASILCAIWLVIRYLLFGVAVEGWTSTMVSLFFLSGLLFANIGVLGLYLGKVFDESKRRPLYLVKERLNVDFLPSEESVAGSAESEAAALPVLTGRRRTDEPSDRTDRMRIHVLEYLEQGALAKCPGKTAIVDGQRSWSFAELASSARQCASRIVRETAATNRPIAVFLPKSAQTIVSDLGILYSGNCYTNLDVKSPSARTKAILANVAPLFVITSRAFRDQVAALGVDGPRILLLDDSSGPAIEDNQAELLRRRARAIDTDPVCIINTSGSTGVPKSVVMHHRGIIDFIDWVTQRFDFCETDSIGSLSPFYFDIFTLELFVSALCGAALCLVPEGLTAFPLRLVEFLAEKRVSFIFWVPSIMVQIANANVLNQVDLTCLKKVFFAGEVFPTKSFNHWRRNLPQSLFVNLYGPIEITVDCTYFVVDREFGDSEPLPIGIPCRNTEILILNAEDRPAAVQETGEICVRGSSLALGYWNSPERTAAAFVQNPLQTAYPEPIYRTGDLGYWNDRGEILFVGRKDYQIKHLGYRIELGEIEAALSSVEAIDEACVLYNKETQAITLFFTARVPPTPAQIRQRLAERIPKYMLPTIFRQLDEMPHNPNGKIDRNRLSQMLREGSARGIAE